MDSIEVHKQASEGLEDLEVIADDLKDLAEELDKQLGHTGNAKICDQMEKIESAEYHLRAAFELLKETAP